VERMRLRCRAHNQYEAECSFGAEFMDAKRNEARRAAAEARARAAAAESRARAAAAETRAGAAAKEQAKEVLAGLRQLGFRADEARRAAEFSETLYDATLEERMRAALKLLGRRSASKAEPGRAWGSRRDEPLCASARSMTRGADHSAQICPEISRQVQILSHVDPLPR